jgi:outer membrane usher protein
MTTPKSTACRWSAIVLSLAGVLAAGHGARAAPPPAGTAGTARDQELYLEITLNTVPTGKLAQIFLRQNAFYADAQTLREQGLRIAPEAQGLIALKELPGLELSYDLAAQRLALTVPIELLDRPVEHIGVVPGARAVVDPLTRAPGLIVNYDLYGQQHGDSKSLSAYSELRLFGAGPGVYSSSMVTRADKTLEGERHANLRLDSYWQRDFPDQALSLTVGDSLTGALSWSRSTRMGGLRLARNFALQPYRVTTPLALFAGSAVLPSTVDLFVNGIRQSSQPVQPGQFELSAVPSMSGSGLAQVMVTDINGQRRVMDIDLYGAPQLLESGLADWSLDFGAMRRDYGIKSFSYGQAIGSASGRYGLSERTTVEGHAEAGDGVRQLGAGAVWLVGRQAGLASASLAASRRSGHGQELAEGEANGLRRSFGYQWSNPRLSLSLNTRRSDAGFRDVGQADGLDARGSDSVFLGLNARHWGQFGLSLVRQLSFSETPQRYVALNWAMQLPGNSSLSLSLSRHLGDARGGVVYLALSMPLDRNLSVGASIQSGGGRRQQSLDASRSPDFDSGGWGWRLQTSHSDATDAQAEVSRLGRYGELTAGLSRYGATGGASSSQAAYVSAGGGLVFMQGGVFASRRINEAFALVSTDGVPGVPVKLENRLIGETDASGMLFVTQLNAYQKNLLSIDTLGLPAEMRVSREMLEAVPETRSGMLASFGMRRVLAVQLSLRDRDGRWLAPGSPVRLDSGTPGAAGDDAALAMVGYDGQVYLEDPPPGAQFLANGDAGSCRFSLPAPLPGRGVSQLGTLTCQ